MAAEESGGFFAYHEPEIVTVLILVSFLVFLTISEWISNKILRAGLIGQIVVGLIYGTPIAGILETNWQDTFMALGYIGLILIIFEGGLSIRLDLMKQNFILSVFAALIGVLMPIALSFALMYSGFDFGALETFIVGTALCSTSLGTTFVVINGASKNVDFTQTRIGTVLVSAAIFDDVFGLVLVSVISQLRSIANSPDANLGWIIGRPILASGLMGILTYLLTSYTFRPLFRRFLEKPFARFKHTSNIILMILVLCAFLSIAAYSGASMLFGSFLAGTFLSALPSNHHDGPFMVLTREDGETLPEKTPTFVHTFEKYFLDIQRFILQPLFFASIGFAIPFSSLWRGEIIWKGIVFTILMVIDKLFVGICVLVHALGSEIRVWFAKRKDKSSRLDGRGAILASWAPATLLGLAMVARGEIGLLIIQIGFNDTPYLTERAFVIAMWAIILNTIIGPVSVGIMLKRMGDKIAGNETWGTQSREQGNGTGPIVARHPAGAGV